MSCLMEHKEKIGRKEQQQGTRKDIKPDLTAERKIGRVRASQEGRASFIHQFACYY